MFEHVNVYSHTTSNAVFHSCLLEQGHQVLIVFSKGVNFLQGKALQRMVSPLNLRLS